MAEVSVVIPSYNSAQYLSQAIDSVLAQTASGLEVLVIDDGSTDDTPAVVGPYLRQGEPTVRYFRQPNSGVAVARNLGIQESGGRYVAFLDADDTWLPHKLEMQLAALAAHPECKVCYSAFTVAASDLSPIGVCQSRRFGTTLDDLLLRGNVIGSICTVLCERSLFESVGRFDSTLSQCADWDMWVRLAALTEFLYLDSPLVTYRQHEANMSRNAPLLEHDSLRVLEKGFSMPGLGESARAGRSAAFGRNYMVLAGAYFHARLYRAFIRCAALALRFDSKQVKHLIGYPARVLRPSRKHRLLR